MVENILGSDWIIEFKSSKEDDFDDCDGYTSTKNGERRICIKKDSYQSKETVLRHELIHAFLFESGLGFCSEWAHNEEMVDYFARNWVKLDNLMKEALEHIDV